MRARAWGPVGVSDTAEWALRATVGARGWIAGRDAYQVEAISKGCYANGSESRRDGTGALLRSLQRHDLKRRG